LLKKYLSTGDGNASTNSIIFESIWNFCIWCQKTATTTIIIISKNSVHFTDWKIFWSTKFWRFYGSDSSDSGLLRCDSIILQRIPMKHDASIFRVEMWTLKMQAEYSSKTLVSAFKTAWCQKTTICHSLFVL
jgi:hypothetical protein